jgi:tRNA(Arg) A34 adenosine deaminase TadA
MLNWLKLARKVSSKSDHRHSFHACLIFKGGALRAFATNKGIRHAEVAALNHLWPSERRGCTLLSVRFTKTGLLANARPCSRCLEAIEVAGLGSVWYSTATRQLVQL